MADNNQHIDELKETNVYSPYISTVDYNNDIPNQQLANRTLFLKTSLDNLQKFVGTFQTTENNAIKSLSDNIDKIKQQVDAIEITNNIAASAQLVDNVTQLLNDVKKLQYEMIHHTHNYAGSNKPGGDANTVNILQDNITKINLVGVSPQNPNKLRRNDNISMEEDSIIAPQFVGNLQGVAERAVALSETPKITLAGDIIGSVVFSGDKDVVINTSLKERSVPSGEYGSMGNYTLSSSGSFVVPDITVNSLGIITRIQNRIISLPKNMGINGITSAIPTDKRIFVLGATEQSDRSGVFTQNSVYIDNHKLYSNGEETVNLSDVQSLTNKTYEGYKLNDACARGVDETVGGTKDDDRLTTSNALARHKHKYALADSVDGSAYKVVVRNNEGVSYMLATNDNDLSGGNVYKDENVYIQDGHLYAKDFTAVRNAYIPGGKIWIDSVEVPSGDCWDGDIDIPKDETEFVHKTREVKLADGLKVKKGNILCYMPKGYILADNMNVDTCDNLVLAADDGVAGTVQVYDSGMYNLDTGEYDGNDCYVGTKGQISFKRPLQNGAYIKKIGYVEGTNLIFRPSLYVMLQQQIQ